MPAATLKAWIPVTTNGVALTAANDTLTELSRSVDLRQTTHIRVQQMHQGYPVFGADAIVHVPATQGGNRSLRNIAASPGPTTKMNGVIYQDLNADLQNTPPGVFEKSQADKAAAQALELARKTYGESETKVNTSKLMVYIDHNKKAHWVFMVNVYMNAVTVHEVPANPVYLLDAQTFEVYQSWNDIKTASTVVKGGGVGGNPKTGVMNYDGRPTDPAPLNVTRTTIIGAGGICALQNENANVFNGRSASAVVKYFCNQTNATHNSVYWRTDSDAANGGFSPVNDALYAGTVVQNLYKSWLGVPMLKTANGQPMVLNVYAHYGKNWENAAWDPNTQQVHLGDGADMFYPLTSVGILAHEVSHGFTSQHSDLIYSDQSGSMNEAFSDMSAQAAEFFSNGTNSWQIGPEVVKENNVALRYLDTPSKDCQPGKLPGDGCSIDDASQYDYLVQMAGKYSDNEDDRQGYIVHLASGVYNHAFYLLATTPGWDTKKAFLVMAQANSHYWTKTSSFDQGACGVVQAAKDFNYAPADVQNAFQKVGVDTKSC